MQVLSGLRLAIAGGGVLGLSTAVLCARAGALVTVFDPRGLGDNASGVAAGMLAPALEAVLEQGDSADFALLQRGYAAWPEFAAEIGLEAIGGLDAGALYVGSDEEVSAVEAGLVALGAPVRRLGMVEARRRQPALGDGGAAALHVAGDGRLEPRSALDGLAAALLACGGQRRREPMTPEVLPSFDATVMAAGFESRLWRERVPELAWLTPIKGHVLHYGGGARSGPVVRSRAGYAAPQKAGVIFGATMEPGCSTLEPDPVRVARLHADASVLFPDLSHTPYTPRTGIRAATPDGRPMVGRTASGVLVATGARRNGWLLAPLVARAMLGALAGDRPEPALDPTRFGLPPAFTDA